MAHARRERKTTYTQLDQNKAKPENLIISKTYLTKVVINSRLLDMQGYKGFI
jgi:hypothetical protein